MQQVLAVRGEPVFHHLVRWPRAIPQYEIGHLERVSRIEQAIDKLPGLFVTGNAFHGVALNDVAWQANLIAEQVSTWLASSESGCRTHPPMG
jgi:oxygen-dependent protoporphyrinogen oxidase